MEQRQRMRGKGDNDRVAGREKTRKEGEPHMRREQGEKDGQSHEERES